MLWTICVFIINMFLLQEMDGWIIIKCRKWKIINYHYGKDEGNDSYLVTGNVTNHHSYVLDVDSYGDTTT